MAQGDCAGAVDLVLAHAEVGGGCCAGRARLDSGAVGLERCLAAEGSVRADVVVVVREGVELRLELWGRRRRGLPGEVALECLV